MNKLTIEEKAKRYDEAIERGKQIQNTPYTAHWDIMKEVAEDLLPELKESEDEKTREWIISTLKSLNSTAVQIDGAYEMMLPAIAWLEKQGQVKKSLISQQVNKTCKENSNSLTGEWSEEDEKFFKTALWHISNSVSNGKSTDCHCDTTDWFKSLKERVQPQPHWKPSKEQMEALRWYAIHLGGADKQTLGELLEELNKL